MFLDQFIWFGSHTNHLVPQIIWGTIAILCYIFFSSLKPFKSNADRFGAIPKASIRGPRKIQRFCGVKKKGTALANYFPPGKLERLPFLLTLRRAVAPNRRHKKEPALAGSFLIIVGLRRFQRFTFLMTKLESIILYSGLYHRIIFHMLIPAIPSSFTKFNFA